MRRPVLALAAALAVSACTYGSAIDIAPFEARLPHAVLPPGDYCEMTLGAAPQVISSEGCLRLEWDGARRLHIMTDLSTHDQEPQQEPEQENAGASADADVQELAIVSLGDDLYAAQFDEPGKTGRHELVTFLAKGDAVAGIGIVADATLRRLAALHPQMVWENLPPERSAGEPAQLITSQPLIKSATVAEIRDFLREASRAALREDKPDLDDLPSVGIRDTSGAGDHAPTKAQLAAGRDLLKRIEEMRK